MGEKPTRVLQTQLRWTAVLRAELRLHLSRTHVAPQAIAIGRCANYGRWTSTAPMSQRVPPHVLRQLGSSQRDEKDLVWIPRRVRAGPKNLPSIPGNGTHPTEYFRWLKAQAVVVREYVGEPARAATLPQEGSYPCAAV